MLHNLYVFFAHFFTWLFLYILPLFFVLFIVLVVTLFLKHLVFTDTGNSIRHKQNLTYAEKRASIESFSLRIEFIFKAFFYGLIISAIVLSIYLWIYEF